MNRFRARSTSTALLRSAPEQVWDVLTDPELLPVLTPYLQRIEVDSSNGVDRWTWHLTHIPVMSATVMPVFTEVMTFDKPTSITFAHDPAKTEERTGVEGSYHLTPVGAGTQVAIDLEIWSDLPLPRLSRIAVQTVMGGVVGVMGKRFGSNMLRHLGK